jgi:FK506-binding protein 3
MEKPEIAAPWKQEELAQVPKKDIVEFLQKNGNNAFLQRHSLKGKLQNVAKNVNKGKLDAAYADLFVSKDFRTEEDDKELAAIEERKKAQEARASAAASGPAAAATEEKSGVPEKKGYRKIVLKKGDKTNFPKKGESVSVRYTGMLENGQIFDTNVGKKKSALTFKVGMGKVIRGWDEAVLEMSKGEKAKITIEPDWAYGAKGVPGTIPPNSTLIFEVELEAIGL